jgi:asparagine synthase (glutamine-hydrolysing)
MLSGWIDLDRTPAEFDAAVAAREPKGGPRRFATTALEVAVDGAEVDVHLERTFLAVACGQPRFADPEIARLAAHRGPAAACAELIRGKSAEAAAAIKGHYALAAIDLRERRITLATDRFATFPLCYGRSGSRFAFADRADSVPLGSPETVDPQAIFEYLYFHVIPAPRTVFKGVHRLEGGYAMVAEPSREHRVRYWTPRFTATTPADPAALAAEFRELARQVVAREADVDLVGCFLSGGTDSSTVAGMLGEVTHRPARTFSIGFDAEGYDEMQYARIAARHFGTQHREHYLTPENLMQGIPAVAAHYDQPFGNSSALPAYYCARLAREDGVTKLLGGDGGDELFGGNARYAKQKLFALYEVLPQALRSSIVEPMLLGTRFADRVPLLRKAASYVRQARLPMPDRMETYNLLTRLGVAEMLEPDFLASVDPASPGRAQRETYAACSGASLVDRMLEYDWKYTLADNDLPKVRGTAALAGMGIGFPFLADEIVDFSLSLPGSFKVRGLKLRPFFKEALRGFLPDSIIAKRKHGFGLPFGVWLTRHDELRTLARSSLSQLAGRGIVRPAFTETLMDKRLAEQPAFYGEMVWILMMLDQWLAARRSRPALERVPPVAAGA